MKKSKFNGLEELEEALDLLDALVVLLVFLHAQLDGLADLVQLLLEVHEGKELHQLRVLADFELEDLVADVDLVDVLLALLHVRVELVLEVGQLGVQLGFLVAEEQELLQVGAHVGDDEL